LKFLRPNADIQLTPAKLWKKVVVIIIIVIIIIELFLAYFP
jgi:hypothetical protein